jgi:hypothetical protein
MEMRLPGWAEVLCPLRISKAACSCNKVSTGWANSNSKLVPPWNGPGLFLLHYKVAGFPSENDNYHFWAEKRDVTPKVKSAGTHTNFKVQAFRGLQKGLVYTRPGMELRRKTHTSSSLRIPEGGSQRLLGLQRTASQEA